MCDDDRCAGGLDHRGDAVRGLSRVERHERAAGLRDAEQRHHQILAAVQQNDDDAVRPHAQAAQLTSHIVCATVEFGVGQVAVAERHRDLRRTASGNRSHHVGQAVWGFEADHGFVPRRLSRTLLLGADRQLREADAWIGDDPAEQRREVLGHPFDRRVVQQVGVVLQGAEQLAVLFAHQQHQVEWRPALADVDGREIQCRRGRTRNRAVLEAAGLFPRKRDLE